VIEAAVVVLRLLEYSGAAILFGSPLFFVYALPHGAAPPRGAKAVAAGATAVLALASVLAIAAQASLFAGSFAEGVTSEAMGAVVSSMAIGKVALVRAGVAALALLLLIRRGRAAWLGVAALGAIAAASLAWMGHAAATEGTAGAIHRLSDALHALAACAWIGALAGFLLLFREGPAARDLLHTALVRFSVIGPGLVMLLLLTGLVNGWVVVGLPHIGELGTTPYGQLLLVKLALFATMLGLAAMNRYRHTAAVARGAPLDAVHRSLALEAAAGLAILAVVAWLGTLEPPAA
jgi:copper resistance protein D